VGFLFFILAVLILVYLIIPFVLLHRMADLREHFGSLERALHALDLRLARLATAASAPAAAGAIPAGPAETPPAPPPAESEPESSRLRFSHVGRSLSPRPPSAR
jgi:hypothetical protein